MINLFRKHSLSNEVNHDARDLAEARAICERQREQIRRGYWRHPITGRWGKQGDVQ